jgi:hypothetical protein
MITEVEYVDADEFDLIEKAILEAEQISNRRMHRPGLRQKELGDVTNHLIQVLHHVLMPYYRY